MENYNKIYNILFDVYRNNIRKKAPVLVLKATIQNFYVKKDILKK